jgi:hypothetical protein
MPDVARVIYNRLAAGTPLQMNSTVCTRWARTAVVTAKDLKLQTPYNTYLNTGLTPTPICSPSPTRSGGGAPAGGGWLYFVLVNKDGTEAFADTYAEQLANEQAGQAARGVRGGVMADRGDPTRETTVVGVIGYPVRHSLSPLLHNTAFAALGLNWTSLAFEVAPGQAAAALDGMRALGVAGCR